MALFSRRYSCLLSEKTALKHLGLLLFFHQATTPIFPHTTGLDARSCPCSFFGLWCIFSIKARAYAFEGCSLGWTPPTRRRRHPNNIFTTKFSAESNVRTALRMHTVYSVLWDPSNWAWISNGRSCTQMDKNLASRSKFCGHSCT